MRSTQVIFVDSSAWFALKDIKDPYHGDSIQFLSSFTGKLVTTNFIVDEAITLALVRLNHKFAHELGEDLWAEKYARLIHVTKADQRAAWELFKVYDDKVFSFTDCTSFAVMERLGLEYAFAFDADFEQTGRFTQVPKM